VRNAKETEAWVVLSQQVDSMIMGSEKSVLGCIA